jgi:hypothetical protein
VADTVYSRLLARAIELEGSAESIAGILRVPDATMRRWMDGRALMPLRAFQKLVSYLAEAEARGMGASSAPQAAGDGIERLTFPVGKVFARCARCEGIEFCRAAVPAAPLRMTSMLTCCTCGMDVIHRRLLERLAEAVIVHKKSDVLALRRAALAREDKSPTNAKTAAQE